jgi:hypothetical protein
MSSSSLIVRDLDELMKGNGRIDTSGLRPAHAHRPSQHGIAAKKSESSLTTVLTLGGFLGFSTGYFFKVS